MMPRDRSVGGRLKRRSARRVLRLAHDGHGAFAVLRDDDDPVDALRDAVAHLFELAVCILVRVPLDDGVARFGERRRDGLVAEPPRTRLEVLEGEADRRGGRLSAERGRLLRR